MKLEKVLKVIEEVLCVENLGKEKRAKLFAALEVALEEAYFNEE